jgi:hypothetical protein
VRGNHWSSARQNGSAKPRGCRSGEEEVARLGAGPLEDFLSFSGPGYIDVIEQLAARNSRLKKVLGHVWQTAEMDSEVWQRVKSIVRLVRSKKISKAVPIGILERSAVSTPSRPLRSLGGKSRLMAAGTTRARPIKLIAPLINPM